MSNEPEQLSVELTEQFYSGQPSLLFENMDDKIIWIGPAANRFIEGKAAMQAVYAARDPAVKYKLSDMSSRLVPVSSQCCEVFLRFELDIFYPDGVAVRRSQRITLLWRRKKIDGVIQWRFAIVQVTNSPSQGAPTDAYPGDTANSQRRVTTLLSAAKPRSGGRLVVRSMDYSLSYIPYEDIHYITGGKARVCVIHTAEKATTVRLLMQDIAALLPDNFCRVHSSYIVNTDKIATVRRFAVQLKCGTLIPIPPKRYRQVEAQLERIVNRGLS